MANLSPKEFGQAVRARVAEVVVGQDVVVERLLIALLTGTVLVVALAIFLPMWDMVSLLQ